MAELAERMKRATVGIAGLGGLGSNVAVALARADVGRLILCDFDRVDESNLNRQQYFVDQVGRSKVECVIENLRRINPQVALEGCRVRLTGENVAAIFGEADVIAECFDTVQAKQMIVETVLARMRAPIVTVSGLAGYGRSNEIVTRRISERLIMVGDGTSGIDTVKLLTAARVGIAAMHQANAILELIMGG
jgi:sulfur carrier protein ThiS adenylyltransferase